VTKNTLPNKFRNLGCLAVAAAVMGVMIIAAGAVVKYGYYRSPARIQGFHELLELKAGELGRRIAPLIEAGDAAGVREALQSAALKNDWLYAELNLYTSSPAADARGVPTFETAATAGNADVLPVTAGERIEAWNALLDFRSFRKVNAVGKRQFLTAAALVRKRVRDEIPLHGFILIRYDYSAHAKK